MKAEKDEARGKRTYRRSETNSFSFDEVETQRENIAEMIRKVEEEIRRDEMKLQFLSSKVTRSSAVQVQLDKKLSEFDARLLQLEDEILPIHNETLKLTRTQDNLRSVSELLIEAVKYQDISQDAAKILNDSIDNHSLDAYLAELKRVAEAKQYFEDKAPENPQGKILQDLQNVAMRSLEEEFERVLRDDVIDCTKEELLHMQLADILSPTKMYSLQALSRMQLIVDYLSEPGTLADLAKIKYSYQVVRGKFVKNLLDGGNSTMVSPPKKRGHFHRNTISSSIRRVRSTATVLNNSNTATTPMTEKQANQKRRGHRQNHSFGGGSLLDAGIDLLQMYEKGTHSFYIHVSTMIVALQREHSLLAEMLPSPLAVDLVNQICDPVVENTLVIGDNLVQSLSAQRVLSGPAGLCLLDILRLFANKEPELSMIMQESCSLSLKMEFGNLINSLANFAYKSLTEFLDSVQDDDTKKIPDDGTVHELTSNTLKYLKAVDDYAEVAGYLLSTEGKLPKSGLDLLRNSNEYKKLSTNTHLPQFVLKVLDSLCQNLSRKARTYEVKSLSAIFLINNYDHVLKNLLASNFISSLRRVDDKIDSRYLDLIRKEREQYTKSTWDAIAVFLADPKIEGSGTLLRKTKDAIKNKYSGFNDGFDAVVEKQQKYSVPNNDLANDIREKNVEYILPLFKAFNDTYYKSGFSQRNPQKYLRYTNETVLMKLQEFFKPT
eukprot:m.160530 g.160530  ORF g.160530 m.160530 type:complete len:719 (-) comp31183_c0_seq1:458-2614(-)